VSALHPPELYTKHQSAGRSLSKKLEVLKQAGRSNEERICLALRVHVGLQADLRPLSGLGNSDGFDMQRGSAKKKTAPKSGAVFSELY
jgi:hypothetical protein